MVPKAPVALTGCVPLLSTPYALRAVGALSTIVPRADSIAVLFCFLFSSCMLWILPVRFVFLGLMGYSLVILAGAGAVLMLIRRRCWGCCDLGVPLDHLGCRRDLREDQHAGFVDFFAPQSLIRDCPGPYEVPWSLVIIVCSLASCCGRIVLRVERSLEPLRVFKSAADICLIDDRPDFGTISL